MSEQDARRPRKRERQDRILSALNVNPALRVHQLSEDLGVSTETIRRDLTELHDQGRIDRTYGGAVYRQRFEPALAERLLLNVHERQAIARRAVELVGEADAIMVGGGPARCTSPGPCAAPAMRPPSSPRLSAWPSS